MLLFLFLLIIIAAICASYYFTNKMSAQRKQILLLKYQNNNLTQVPKSVKNITVEYMLPRFNKGIILKKCELFISPLNDSPILNFLNENTLVEIHDSALIDDDLWYEVSLTPKQNINSKGWVHDIFIKFPNEDK